MDRAAIQRTAEGFWAQVGEPEPYPRQLEPAVLWVLPLAVFKLPRLLVGDVQDWLAAHGVRFRLETGDRPLHGCLLAYGGRGCVLLNGADSPEELRFSLAHEVAHFLLDYHDPRLRAVSRLGPQILEVLNGRRPATVQERVQAILSHVPIGFHSHLMDRQTNGEMDCDPGSEREGGADQLALELLAPELEVRRRTARHTPDRQPQAEVAKAVLQQQFGLPATVAVGYARLLFPAARNYSVREWLRQRENPSGKMSNFPPGRE